MKFTKSLLVNFVVYILIAALSCISIASVLLYKNTEQSLLQIMNQAAESKLRSLTNISSYYIGNYETELLERLEADVRTEESVAHIQIFDADDKPFFELQPAFGTPSLSYEEDITLDGDKVGRIEIAFFTDQIDASLNHSMVASVLAVLFAAVLILICVYFLFRKKVSDPLTHISRSVHAMADGDLTQRVHIRGEDEIANLGSHFNLMLENLSSLFSQVGQRSSQSEQESTRVSDIAHSLNDLCVDANQRTAVVVGAMQNLQVNNDGIQQLAHDALEIAESTKKNADDGLMAVRNNIDEMEKAVVQVGNANAKTASLGGAAEQIQSITEVISNIADQTNLLALNAAIEAARAGEQGRGFAVVADEVRALAKKTSDSSREIASIVENLVSHVTQANGEMDSLVSQAKNSQQQALEAAEKIEKMAADAEQSAGSSREITIAVDSQRQQFETLDSEIKRLDRALTEVSDGARQTAEIGADQKQRSSELSKMVSKFRCL
ncbi:MAG: methyl-accepting chemotaxis protein [Motiliproteus sp.]